MKTSPIAFLFLFILLPALCAAQARISETGYDPNPPFGFDLLQPVTAKTGTTGGEMLYNPRNPYAVSINYELGMHCVGFDISYCCIIPPYNSIQAQAVQSGMNGARPRFLSADDNVLLYYGVRDNTYSEGNKMRFWQAPKDVTGRGTMDEPNDNMPNYVWSHLFIYKDLLGMLPGTPESSKRKYIGRDMPVNIDSGPSNKPLSGGYMDYAREKGGNIVFTDSLLPDLRNVPLALTSSYLWDALGLPLTAFNDSRRKGSIRTITDLDFQPYQYATVQLRDRDGRPLLAGGKPVEFFGSEPIDIANCQVCHSGQGMAANLARGGGLQFFDREYAYWRTQYPDTSDYYARMASASILILELHDQRHKTHFLKGYNPAASSNRLGKVGPVNCADCHGDNISGNLQTPRPGTTGYRGVRAKPLSEAIHSVHALLAKMPDAGGRTQNCQACHPNHWQNEKMNDMRANPYQITDELGNPRFSDKDVRISGGGCYLRRDAHTNADARPPFFLNEIGRWYLTEVSMKDEKGRRADTMRGLYCTHCHNRLSQELYRRDELQNSVGQQGTTLRNKPIRDVILGVSGGDDAKFKSFFADPVVGAQGDPLFNLYAQPLNMPLAKSAKGENGKTSLLPWNGNKGKTIAYADASGGNIWWVSPGEPHCADCHAAPFVESAGGNYFPIDQPGKYSLFRYSKAHGVLACQTCHESMHSLYPVRFEEKEKTVDLTAHEQALQFSPDGKYVGPITCAACHTVNRQGVPTLLGGTSYERDYWASVVLVHFMREGDQTMPIAELVKKFLYERSKQIVTGEPTWTFMKKS